MALAHLIILHNQLTNKDPDVVPEQSPLIILYSKLDVYISKNGKYTKQTRHLSIIMHFVINIRDCNLHETVWFEEVLQLEDIGTNNVREYELNSILGYDIV